MVARALYFPDSPFTHPDWLGFTNTIRINSYRQLCVLYQSKETPELLHTWKVLTKKDLPTNYKGIAALGKVLINRKCELEYDKTFFECLKLVGEEHEDSFISWVYSVNLLQREKLISLVHKLLSIDEDQIALIKKIFAEPYGIKNLKLIVEFLEFYPSRDLKIKVLYLLSDVPQGDWGQVLSFLKLLLDTTPNEQTKIEILDAAYGCEGRNQLKVLTNATHCTALVRNQSVIPILKLLSSTKETHITDIHRDLSRLVHPTESGEKVYELLKFLTKFSCQDRNQWSKETFPIMLKIPLNMRIANLRAYIFTQKVLNLFESMPRLPLKDPKTPLSHIR